MASQDIVSEGEDDCNLTAQECQALIDNFIAVTDTNEPQAMQFLQQRNWNLEAALDDFFTQSNQVSKNRKSKSKASKVVNVVELSSSDDEVEKGSPEKKVKHDGDVLPASSSETKSVSGRSDLILITWNIDGISDKNLVLRTEAVCKIIQDIKADIVFLQEVIPDSEKIIRNKLDKDYAIKDARIWKSFPAQYYTLNLVKKNSYVKIIESEVIDYKLSVMTRNMNISHVSINGVTAHFVNTHLESTKDYSSHRIEQMSQIHEWCQTIPREEPVVIAGDLNMRDKELEDAGGLPRDWIDVWESTGKKKECQYTWDMTRNDNLQMNSRWKPRCRFDRVLVRDSKPSKLMPVSFNLIGIERLKPHVCFPSDHWGIMSLFHVFHKKETTSTSSSTAGQ